MVGSMHQGKVQSYLQSVYEPRRRGYGVRCVGTGRICANCKAVPIGRFDRCEASLKLFCSGLTGIAELW